MNWYVIRENMGNCRLETAEGYIIMRSRASEVITVYIARAPKTAPVLYAGYDFGEAKAACERHLEGEGNGQ